MNPARPNLHEDIADATEIAVEKYLRTQGPHVPVDRCVYIPREKMHVVKVIHLALVVFMSCVPVTSF